MTSIQRVSFGGLLLAGLLLAPAAARAADSYDSCTGFIDAVPMTLATQGVWCLRHDLATAITSGAAITIAGNNITIDCNGFKLGGLAAGNSSNAVGIIANLRQNATVRHCNVRGFFRGIELVNGAGHLVEDNRLDNNLHVGIHVVGDNSLVQRNRVFDTGGYPDSSISYGIYARADVLGNTVSGVFADAADVHAIGIRLFGNGSDARDNRVRGLVQAGSGVAVGIDVFDVGSRIDGNHVSAAASITGWGVSGHTQTACLDNVVINFANAYSGCSFSAGNAALP